MRCEPPMPAQFISTRAMPWADSALASPALTCSSSVTSAWTATPFTSAATFSAFSLLCSSTAIFAPLAAMARAVAAPRPEPPPVMRTATSFNCMMETFPWAFLLGLQVLWACKSCRLVSRAAGQSSSSDADHLLRVGRQHAAANQRFHVPDVLAADFVGDRPDAGRARHRMPSEKQMVAGADQARIEQHRIDGPELAGLDAFREQPAMKIQQRGDKELRHLVGGLGAAFMQQIVDQPVHIGKLVIRPDDAGDMQPELRGRRDRLRQQVFEVRYLGRSIPRQQSQQQTVLVAEMIFHQRGVDAGFLGDIAQGHLDRRALDHQLARRDEELLGRGVFSARNPVRYAGIQL